MTGAYGAAALSLILVTVAWVCTALERYVVSPLARRDRGAAR